MSGVENIGIEQNSPLSGKLGTTAAIEFSIRSFRENLVLADMAKAAKMPRNTLTRKFNTIFGLSPIKWLWLFRTVLAAELITAFPDYPLAQISDFCGFTSNAHFSRRFKLIFKKSPSEYKTEHLNSNTIFGATVNPQPYNPDIGDFIYVERAVKKLNEMVSNPTS